MTTIIFWPVALRSATSDSCEGIIGNQTWLSCNFSYSVSSMNKMLSYRREIALQRVIAFAKSRRLELGDSILQTTYDVHLGLIGKRVVDFLLMLIELFSLGVTAESLRAKRD